MKTLKDKEKENEYAIYLSFDKEKKQVSLTVMCDAGISGDQFLTCLSDFVVDNQNMPDSIFDYSENPDTILN